MAEPAASGGGLPPPLYRFSELVYRVSSDGIYAIDEDSADKPTRNTVQAVANAYPLVREGGAGGEH
ncbi:hypothetical protein [Geobacter grbiciae]|uniref:hypothetical protein n=1 Tax=Geobacter grbiciae TaxID=155042 RepID=UPI001FE81273|nr:hypothetical protein [Geobacter grbiciae]